jgi:cytochrome P450
MMIRRDGEDHTRLRRVFSKAFTPRAVQQWRERTEAIVEAQLDAADEAQRIDVIHDYALPIPSLVISEMLGVPSADNAQLQEWSDVLVTNLEPGNTPERQAAVETAGRAMLRYLEELVIDRRAHPADDLLTAMIMAEDRGDVLDDEEIQAQVMLLYIAGHETTVNLIGNGLLRLLENPEQLARLQVDPTLDANAVEEILRFDSPAQFTRRLTHQPMELGGVEIPEDALLVLSLGGANHDPAKWGDTVDTIDIARAGANEHVSFGGGPHFCLGAALARMEGQIGLSGIIRRFPKLERESSEAHWAERTVLRGLDDLAVRVR